MKQIKFRNFMDYYMHHKNGEKKEKHGQSCFLAKKKYNGTTNTIKHKQYLDSALVIRPVQINIDIFIFTSCVQSSTSSVDLTSSSQLFGNIWLSMASLVIFMQLRYLFHEVQRRIRRHKNYLRVIDNMESRLGSHLQGLLT